MATAVAPLCVALPARAAVRRARVGAAPALRAAAASKIGRTAVRGVQIKAMAKKGAEEVSTPSFDTEEVIKTLQEKWEQTENKSSIALYAGGSFAAIWASSAILGAVNSLPLLPKIFELVGLGYTTWFVYRYLLFKESRKELGRDIEELKKRISGSE